MGWRGNLLCPHNIWVTVDYDEERRPIFPECGHDKPKEPKTPNRFERWLQVRRFRRQLRRAPELRPDE